MEQTGIIIKTEEERSDLVAVGCVPEAADHAIRGAFRLDLDHRAFAWPVGIVEPLGDDTVERSATSLEPIERFLAVIGDRGKQEVRIIFPREQLLERGAAFGERFACQHRRTDRQAIEGNE